MRSKYFFGFIISFICGVAIESIFDFGYSFGVWCVLLAIIVLLAHGTRSHSKNVLLVSLVFLGLALGIFRVDVSQRNIAEQKIDNIVGKTLELSGILVSAPDVREEYANIVLETRKISNVLNEGHRILVRIPVYPELHYGDEVVVVGKLAEPKNFEPDENGKVFDYRAYLAKDGIYYQMFFPSVTVIAEGKGNMIIEKLFVLKAWLMKNISQKIPEPESSLAGGITLGIKQSLGTELLQKFRETGVAHIVVLSGYNIAIVASIISQLFMFMPFALRLTTSALGIVLFALMVGGGATVVRATVMALVVILARMLGRESDALRVLVLAGGLMVFVNPMILLNDVSFQLSFLATFAIVVFIPVIEKYFTFISHRVLREIVVTTFATQIFVLPLILYYMGSVSLIGFISNIFILPVVPIAMLVVALVAVLAWVPLVSSALAFLAYVLLAYIFLAVEFFARVPFASLQGISFPLFGLILAYTILGMYIYKNFPRKTFTEKSEF